MCALLFVLIGQTSGAIASEATAAESAELRVDRTTDGVFLSTSLQFALPELAEDALYKGIPMFFVAEAQVLRHRWYWSDKQVAQATRYLRLSYQPLTRRWRLNTSTVPFANSGLGVVLGQNFDDYNDAMAAVQRIARWKIADASAMESDALHTVNLRFRLDMSQLPRPFQIGAVGQSGWNVLVSRSQRLMPEPAK
ncbi:DUF4390 domain-containing protein [Acidovorax sp. RAC01]|uniref:DUF4390 domain-containing protein n=1 Tax=Acidovorax sp. RAC01 TaxID=1842533 RepID=UPI00083E8DAB|nr:DUF4390 domain-containing protein [Acidovorax sp. RAC01]